MELCVRGNSYPDALLLFSQIPKKTSHFSSSGIKSAGGWCKSSVSTYCEALKRKETQ